jgi:predicted RNase H-like HicB family nuclease
MAGYIALVHKDKDTSYGVSFPDVPGCIAAGDTFEEAIANAAEALAGHFAMLRADNETLPSARNIEQLNTDENFVADSEDAIIAFVVPSDTENEIRYVGRARTAIRSVAYEASRRELFVTFVSGRTYVYDNVPPDVVESFRGATSRGSFFNHEVRDRFVFRELGEQFSVAAE